MQQHHERRLAWVVMHRVLETEVQVIEERAIRVLHVEVALVDEETKELLVDARQRVVLSCHVVCRLNPCRRRRLPVGLLRDARLHDVARGLALEGSEDGPIQVEVRDRPNRHITGVVRGASMGDGGLSKEGGVRAFVGVLLHVSQHSRTFPGSQVSVVVLCSLTWSGVSCT